ncbi:MAG: hypothetical protein AB7O62_10990 [Pirellulales bacterium]
MPRLCKFPAVLLLATIIIVGLSRRAGADEPSRAEFTRLVAHWAEYREPGYLQFIDEAQPDVAQVGFYGGHFWSLAHTEHGQGYPAHFPVVGLNECGQWFQNLNSQLHQRPVKAVGHFNVKFLVGDPESPEGPRGFFKFYNDLWDEAELGPKPVADPRELLEINADGSLLSANNYSIGGMKEYWGCLNNPHWRTVLKAWAKRGIERGVDGYIINYFYRHDCHCQHCQKSFRDYLAQRFTPAELQANFAIADLAGHKFMEIASWHDPAQSTPLKREMLRFSQVANKAAYDDVFVDHARKLKPGLLLAQWNHLGDFNQINGDERCMLPGDLWGKDEDYLWYSTGGAACFTDLAEDMLGDATLQCRYIRGAFDDKPYTLGKYEISRIRAAIAELAANGGAPMGFYTRFTDPEAKETIVRYYQFLKRYDHLYRGNRPHGEVELLYPRTSVHAGDVAAVESFKQRGKELLRQHILFDVRPDDVAATSTLGPYRETFNVATPDNSAAGSSPIPPTSSLIPSLSLFHAPSTVIVSASRPAEGNEVTLHFVNYNRTEPAEKRSAGGAAADEKPIAAPGFDCDLALPAGTMATRLTAMTPESPEPVAIPFETVPATATTAARLRFKLPGFLVYQVARVELEQAR